MHLTTQRCRVKYPNINSMKKSKPMEKSYILQTHLKYGFKKYGIHNHIIIFLSLICLFISHPHHLRKIFHGQKNYFPKIRRQRTLQVSVKEHLLGVPIFILHWIRACVTHLNWMHVEMCPYGICGVSKSWFNGKIYWHLRTFAYYLYFYYYNF